VTADSDTAAVPGRSSGDEALTNVLAHLAAEGYGTDFVPADRPGTLRCPQYESVSAIGDFRIERERRLEGASDPDDMVLVVAAACPVCGARGTVALGYGPEASPEDADLVSGLPRSSG
jgi:hypothetical protein